MLSTIIDNFRGVKGKIELSILKLSYRTMSYLFKEPSHI